MESVDIPGTGDKYEFMIRRGMIWLLLALFGLAYARANDSMDVESRVLGNGWFEYRVRTYGGPFLASFGLSYLSVYPFTNYVEAVIPQHWISRFATNSHAIEFDYSTTQPLVNETVFRIKSSASGFRTKPLGFGTVVDLTLTESIETYIPYIKGLVKHDCLVPCDPGQSDGSPTNLVSHYTFVPGIKIDELIATNGEIHGVKFSWDYDSTVQLEGSHDLAAWIPITWIWGSPPQTTWTTNISLHSFGQYFRLLYVGGRHISNTNTAARSPSKLIEVAIRNLRIADGTPKIEFDSTKGTSYEIICSDFHGKFISSMNVVASNSNTIVDYEVPPQHAGAGFRVVQLTQ